MLRGRLAFPYIDYIVVGAETLDYKGLDILSREGLLIASKKMPGGLYVFTGFEAGTLNMPEQWMWGHNSIYGKYLFSTHGKLPLNKLRAAFPDLAWMWVGLGLNPDEVTARMIEIGNILATLLERDIRFVDLQETLKISVANLTHELALLYSLRYVDLVNKLLRLNTPILNRNDHEEIQAISEKLVMLIARRFRENFCNVKEYYRETLPAKNNVPVEEAFNPIYHVVFAGALDIMMNDEIVHKPPLRPDGANYAAYVVVTE